MTQKRLRSARPKARFTRPPNGAWTTSCIPPASSKKRSKTTSSIVGTIAEGVALRRHVGRELRGRRRAASAHSAREPRARVLARVEPGDDVGAQPAHLGRELPGARRAPRRARTGSTAAGPARPRRARTPRARLDAPDAPRVRPEDEHVARHALDRPVLVDRADERLVRVEHDAVVGDVGDRAAVRERHDARRAPPAQRPVDAIAVHAARRRDRACGAAPFGDARDDVVEVARARAPRRASPGGRASKSASSRPLARRALGHDLLREDVERRARRVDAIEPPARDRADERGALDELVARRREEPPARRAPERVARAPDALQERRDRARRADLADEVDRADVDPQLERRRWPRARASRPP